MPLRVIGTGAVVRPIVDTDQLQAPIKLCVIGEDGDRDTGSSGASFALYGAPWLRRIIVTIRPVDAIGPVPASALDADGCALHCVWEFPGADDLRQAVQQQGFHRPSETQSIPPKAPIWIESNGGSFRVPRGTILWFAGGAEGTPWDVDVIEEVDENLGHPDFFELDVLAGDGVSVIRPAWHEVVQPLAGVLVAGGGAATTAGSLPEISLAQPSIVTRGATLYRTRVAL